MNLSQGVLVVDADEMFLEMMEKFISEKYNFYAVTNVVAMYQALETEAVTLLVIDYNMNSTHTGLEIAINVKKNYPFIKILLVTSHVSHELVKAAINSGAVDAFLEKPIRSNELSKIISDNIKQSQSTRTKFERVIKHLREKEKISRDMISEFGGELPLLDLLYNESLSANSETNNKCIGIVVFKNNEIYIQKFLNELVIENEFLFSSFLRTLELLSAKFKIEGKVFQEIEFESMFLWVFRVNMYTFVYFLNANTLPETKDENILKRQVYSIYSRLVTNDYLYLNENIGDMILRLNDLLAIENS